LHAERLLFAEANGIDAIGGDAQGDEVLLDGAGTTIAESKVVLGGAALVAVAFDGDALGWVVTKILSRFTESGASVSARVSLVEVEVGVLHQAMEEFVLRRFVGRSCSSRDGDACARCRRTTRTAGSNGVGRRGRRSD